MRNGKEAKVVGAGFKPGAEGNAQIARLLGQLARVDDGAARIATSLMPTEFAPCPDYSGDLALAAELMEFHDRVPYLKPVRGGGHVCIFDHGGEVCTTGVYDFASHAFAAAIYFVLKDKSCVT